MERDQASGLAPTPDQREEAVENTLSTWEYQTPTVCLVPYSKHTRNLFPENIMAVVYDKFKRQNLLATIMPECPELIDLSRFISYMEDKTVTFYCLKNDWKIVGIAWIDKWWGLEWKRAEFGFGVFKDYWGQDCHTALTWFVLAWWFKELNINVLYGMTLTENRLSQRYSRIFGFQKIADIPYFFYRKGMPESGSLVVLEREEFLKRYEAIKPTLK